MIIVKSERKESKHHATNPHSTSSSSPLSKGALAHSGTGKRKQYSSSMTSYSRKSSYKQKRASKLQKQPPVAYNNPYSSDSSDGRNKRHSGNTNERTKPLMRSPKRRRNSASSSAFFQSNRDILDTQLFAFIAGADDAGSAAFEIDGEDDEDDDEDDDDEGGADGDIEEIDGDDEAGVDEDEDDHYDQIAELQLSNESADDADEDEEQIELEEEAAIVKELSIQELEQVEDVGGELAAVLAESSDSSSSGESDDDDDDLPFADTLFVDKSSPALLHIVSTAPRKYHDSDDDSFILNYFFSSGESSDDDQKDSTELRARSISKRRRRHNTFSDEFEESEIDNDNEGFELKTDELSGIEMSVRKVGNFYDADDGESTDEDENLPPPSHRKAGHRGTEILVSSVAASKPPVLGSWVLPVGRHIGIINGLATRTLSPPPYPRGSDGDIESDTYRSYGHDRHHHDYASSPSVMAAAAARGRSGLRRGSRAFDRDASFGSDSERSDVALEEFIYMSELDNDDDEPGDLSTVETTPGPTSTPVWAGKFHSKFPLSAFRNSSSMQYRSI
ncbi:transcription factor CRF1-domain-containing protein [Lipomyces kononenkoae]|uniref:Transcription factor CRF1-domain-containing protein n=1 Tax=Lipomyces kononenkoae TaxID=34357 RepID=A0ACC3SZM3_LIPKO